MSDIRTRIAEALREHVYEWRDNGWHCAKCDVPPAESALEETDDWSSEHVINVLLSLPGIAIVELPEPNIIQDTYQSWRFFENGDDEYVTWPANDEADELHVSGIGPYAISDARAFAAALLAAAATVAAEPEA